MRTRVAIVYNEPVASRYNVFGEEKAAEGVLQAVEAVHRALLDLGYLVIRVPIGLPLEGARRKLESLDIDLAFNLFEGFCGYPETEAMVPDVLTELGIPHTGCPAHVLELALDKAKVKVLLQAASIKTPDFQLLNSKTLHMFRLGYPCIVKPRGEDASHGLSAKSVVTDDASLKKQVQVIGKSYRCGVMVEKFVGGREFNATVLGNGHPTVLPVSEIAYSLPPDMPRILTFAAKWEPESLYFKGTRAICPAEIGTEAQELIVRTATEVFRLLGCRGYARVDMRMDGDGFLNVIEVNPNPDISPGSGAVLQAETFGLTYKQFVERIVMLALETG